jgi:hypothetical protein
VCKDTTFLVNTNILREKVFEDGSWKMGVGSLKLVAGRIINLKILLC